MTVDKRRDVFIWTPYFPATHVDYVSPADVDLYVVVGLYVLQLVFRSCFRSKCVFTLYLRRLV